MRDCAMCERVGSLLSERTLALGRPILLCTHCVAVVDWVTSNGYAIDVSQWRRAVRSMKTFRVTI